MNVWNRQNICVTYWNTPNVYNKHVSQKVEHIQYLEYGTSQIDTKYQNIYTSKHIKHIKHGTSKAQNV